MYYLCIYMIDSFFNKISIKWNKVYEFLNDCENKK